MPVRGIVTVSRRARTYEAVRRWVMKFGPIIARELRRRGARPSDRWHLDEMVVEGEPLSSSPLVIVTTPAAAIAIVPTVEGRPGNAQRAQGVAHRQRR
jgi:hypothetical protein